MGTVWLGYDEPASIGNAATGGSYAAPVWGRIMRTFYTQRRGWPGWRVPSNVTERRIDPYTGYVLENGCQPQYGTAASELFIAGNVPASSCPYRDWWGDIWDRIGGVFGGGGRNPPDDQRRRDNDDDDDDGNDEDVRAVPQSRERSRLDDMDEFLRRRSERIRERRGNRGTEN